MKSPVLQLAALAVLSLCACRTPAAESTFQVGDRAFAEGRFEEAGDVWTDESPDSEAALLFRHAVLCAKLTPPCLPGDVQAIFEALARDYPQTVFGEAAARRIALQRSLAEAKALAPVLAQCRRDAAAADEKLTAEKAEKEAAAEALHAAQAQLTKLSKLAELQSFEQEVQRLQGELEAERQERERLVEELDALKRIDLRN